MHFKPRFSFPTRKIKSLLLPSTSGIHTSRLSILYSVLSNDIFSRFTSPVLLPWVLKADDGDSGGTAGR
jgi:hypothetical protein